MPVGESGEVKVPVVGRKRSNSGKDHVTGDATAVPMPQPQGLARVRIITGNLMMLGVVAGFLQALLLMAGWWLWTVYGIVGMSSFFRPAEATVLSSNLVCHESSENGDRWEVRLRYRYEVDGREYEGYRLNPTLGGGFDERDDARKVRDRYPPGTKFTVRYDPHMPSQSAVSGEVGQGQAMTLLFVPAFFLIGLLIAIVRMTINRRRYGKREKPPLMFRLRKFLVTPHGGIVRIPLERSEAGVLVLIAGLGLAFCTAAVAIMVTAFTPREPSQIAMGTMGQFFFGSIFFMMGLGMLGYLLSFTIERRKPSRKA